jgi:S-DNA-T family DNA segregation ATPase FtsK/SpoIIIE
VIEDGIKEKLKHEIVGILLIAVGIFLLLSLISYHPMDPSFFSYTSSKVKGIHNWMGVVGAYLSSLLFQGFGYPSFLIPFALFVFAFSFIIRWEWKYLSLKAAGWVVILLTTSALVGLWLKNLHRDTLAGGFIGEIFFDILTVQERPSFYW